MPIELHCLLSILLTYLYKGFCCAKWGKLFHACFDEKSVEVSKPFSIFEIVWLALLREGKGDQIVSINEAA